MLSFKILTDIFLVFPYFTRLKARQILSRLIKYNPVFQKKAPNNTKGVPEKASHF